MSSVVGLVFLVVYLAIIFVIVYAKKDTSIGNFSWGGGCLLLTLYTFFAHGNYHARQVIVTALITLWCVRLAYYVYARYKKGADRRYVAWLEQWQNPLVGFAFSFVWIFMLNGFFAVLMSLPSLWINTRLMQPAFGMLDMCGVVLWLIGFWYESVSDNQLYAFMRNPENKGTVCNQGLWRYSRHPNYFGEILMWWGIYVLALAVPCGWITMVTPIAITVTLVFVTGIPWNEKAMESNPEYQEYAKKTSMLIPWFVKN